MVTLCEALVACNSVVCDGGEVQVVECLSICFLEVTVGLSNAEVEIAGVTGVVAIKIGFDNELDGESVK